MHFKCIFSLLVSAVDVCSMVMILLYIFGSLFVVASIVCVDFMFSGGFVIYFFVSFLVLR